MRYWITKYSTGRYGVRVETNAPGKKTLIEKGIYDCYKDAVDKLNELRKEERNAKK